MASGNKFREISDILAIWVTILSAVLGGIVWLNTYVKDVHSRLTDRQKESVKYYDRYTSPDVVALRNSFYQIKRAVSDEIKAQPPAVGNAAAASDKLEHQIQSRTFSKITDLKEGLDIRRLVEFFDSVEVCIDIAICDRRVAVKFFHEDAYDLAYNLKAYLDDVSGTRLNFGSGLRKLASPE